MKDTQNIGRLTGRLSNNIYVIEQDDELVVVDPGMPSDRRRLFRKIHGLGRSPKEVTAILLTHFHVDHAGCAAALKDISGATVYAHREDVPYLEGSKSMPSVYRAGVQGRALMLLPGTVEKYSRVPPVEVDVGFEHGDILQVLGGLEVIHAPGHTPGSSCFFWRDRGVLFTGDAIQNLYFFLTLPEPGFCWDLEMAGRTAGSVVDALEDEEISLACTGHGPVASEAVREKLYRFREGLRRKGKA